MCTEYLLGARYCLILNSPLIYMTLVTTPWSSLSLDSGFSACGDSLFNWQLLPHPSLIQWCPPGFSAQPCSSIQHALFWYMWPPLAWGQIPLICWRFPKLFIYLYSLGFQISMLNCLLDSAIWKRKIQYIQCLVYVWGGIAWVLCKDKYIRKRNRRQLKMMDQGI